MNIVYVLAISLGINVVVSLLLMMSLFQCRKTNKDLRSFATEIESLINARSLEIKERLDCLKDKDGNPC